jgi:hypothetical protein
VSLPNKLDSSSPTDSDLANTTHSLINGLVTAIEDIFGVVDATQINHAAFSITAAGLQSINFQDAAADPATAGYLQRNGTALRYHDSVAARTVYMEGGTDVAVADGGTGLSSGTSGGILGYTGSTTIASSAALTAKSLLLGGGAGATPTALGAMTNGQLAIGSTGANPVRAALASADNNLMITNAAGSITLAAVDRVTVWCGAAAALLPGGANYLGSGSSTSEGDVSWPSPVSGVVVVFTTAVTWDSHPTDAVWTFTLRVAGSDGFSHVIDSALATTGSANGSAAVTAGDRLSVSASTTGDNNARRPSTTRCLLLIQPTS